MRIEMRRCIGLQCGGHHGRAEIGTADADVDDIGERLAGMPAQLASAHCLAECLHLVEHTMDIRNHILAVDGNGLIARRPQRGMQNGSLLRQVEFFTADHLPRCFFHAALFGQLDQQGQGFRIDQVLRVVEQDAVAA